VPAVLILGDPKIDVERILVGGKRTVERLRRRTRLRLRHVEEQAVGQDTGRGGQRERSGRQRLAIDLELLEPPRAKGEGGELKLEEVLEESVLGLKVLGTEQHALRPQHRLHLPHERRT